MKQRDPEQVSFYTKLFQTKNSPIHSIEKTTLKLLTLEQEAIAIIEESHSLL